MPFLQLCQPQGGGARRDGNLRYDSALALTVYRLALDLFGRVLPYGA